MVEVDVGWMNSVNSQLSNLNYTTINQGNRIAGLDTDMARVRADLITLFNQCAELERKLTLLTNAHNALAAKTTQHISTGERGTDV